MKHFVYVYHWLYVKLYLFSLKAFSKRYVDNNFHACAMLIVCLVANFHTLLLVMDYLASGWLLKTLPSLSKAKFLTGMIVFACVNIFYFTYKGKYKVVLSEFDVEKQLMKPRNHLVGLGYLIGSWLTFGILLLVLMNIR